MQASNAPSKSPVPFAESGSKNTIPVASQIGVTPGLASFTDGFPPLTMTPLAAGGVPPYGQDFNGILYFLSAAVRWQQAGGSYAFDSAFSSAIGGYPKGALLRSSDSTAIFMSRVDNNTVDPGAGPSANWQVLAIASPKGECRLALSGASLVLSPFGGNQLYINGANRAIPSAGVPLAATGLSVGTTYYIYAYWTGSAIALEASTTGHSADSSTGVEIKTGDATRTLVGMARTVTGPAWKDDYDQRFVLSWYNRQAKVARKQLVANATINTAGPAEVSSNLRAEFLTWTDGVSAASMTGGAQMNTSTFSFRLGFDGVSNLLYSACICASNTAVPLALTDLSPSLSEGYHYLTLAYIRSTGTDATVTGTFNGNTNTQVQVMG